MQMDVKNENYTVEGIKNEIMSFNTLSSNLPLKLSTLDSIATVLSVGLNNELDRKLLNIGRAIEYLAETKYGAPTDKQIAEATNVAGQNLLQKAITLTAYGKVKIAEANEISLQKFCIHADLETHPIMTERYAVWQEKEPEVFSDWLTRIEEIKKLGNLITDILNEAEDARVTFYEKRNDAMMQALKDVGVIFADPNTFKFSPKSDDDAVRSLKNAIKFYPQSWVDASNKRHIGRPLIVANTAGRAEYWWSHHDDQGWFQPITEVVIVTKPKGWKPDPHDLYESQYVDLKGKDTWPDPLSPVIHRNDDENKEEGTSWLLVTYQYYEGEGTPADLGWEKVELYKNQTPETIQNRILKTYYRKPRTFLHKTHGVSLLTVSKDKIVRIGSDDGRRAAMHEFAHRVDHTTPVLMVYEQCFLNRRAGNYPVPEGGIPHSREVPTPIKGREDSYGYKGNFPNHYMGKVSGDARGEILSMGMETLFLGSYGGFVGLGNHNPDAEYKRFILGMLASSATG